MEAANWGMFLEAVSANNVLSHAIALANDIAQLSPNAVQITLKTLRESENSDIEAALWKEAVGQSLCYGHAEMTEGLRAIQEKRRPRF